MTYKNIVIGLLLLTVFSCSPPNCEEEKKDYSDGHSAGNITKLMGGGGSCYEYVNAYNDISGSNKTATKCFCSGFEDGTNGIAAKF